jgi:2,4-dienoyl-CoA reductase-like NADH-dependent reductase (Old Yellow Enzyme family)
MTSGMNLSAIERRFFFLPVNTGYVQNSLPTDRYIEFYEARSGHGIHCVIVGNVVIPGGFASNYACAEISDSEAWKHLTAAIKAKGARAGIQLSTAWEKYQGIKQFVPSSGYDPVSEYRAVLADTSPKEIAQVFENLRRGIELSVYAGFTHIQVHAAHGYLFSLLLDKEFCQYSELALAHLDWIAAELNSTNIESSIRISLTTGDKGVDQNRSEVISKILGLPFTFFDISFGFYNINKHLIYPSTKYLLKKRLALSLALAAQFPDKQIIISGKSIALWHTPLPDNVHIGIGRDLIANPNFLRDRTTGCTDCMKCHYYSNSELQLRCEKWESGNKASE